MKRILLPICLSLCSACAIQRVHAQWQEGSLVPDLGYSLKYGTGLSAPYQPVTSDMIHFRSLWRYGDLGLFCKLDVVFERKLKFPVLFRLGDVHRVEAWEGKGAWRSVY